MNPRISLETASRTPRPLEGVPQRPQLHRSSNRKPWDVLMFSSLACVYHNRYLRRTSWGC